MKEYEENKGTVIKGHFTSTTVKKDKLKFGEKGSLRWKLPKYWGIDLVCFPLMVAVTVYIVLHWKEIIFRTAQIVSQFLVGASIILVFALVIAVVVAIRNKKIW